MSPLNPQAPRPLYLQLADELRERIRRGDLKPGERLPAERELSETYGTSLSTIKLALGALKAEALITSGHGRGTFVRTRPPARLEFHRFAPGQREPGSGPFKAAVERVGMRGQIRLAAVERQAADAELAHRLGIGEGDQVIVRSRHMLADGDPVQLFDAFYPLALFEGTELEAPELTSGGIHAAFQRLGRHPERAVEEVSARAPTPDESRLLRLGTGVPVLTVTRTTYDPAGQALEVTELVANADVNVFLYEGPLD